MPSKKKKEIYEKARIVDCYEWVRPDESLTGLTSRAFIHEIEGFFFFKKH